MSAPALIVTREGIEHLADNVPDGAEFAEFSRFGEARTFPPPPDTPLAVERRCAYFSHVDAAGRRVFVER